VSGIFSEGTQRERVPVGIFEELADIASEVAGRIATLIRARASEGKSVVLGLSTSSTTIGVYKHLVRMHEEEGLDFSTVVTFNLDEYYPMDPNGAQSYCRFLQENLFDHVNIPDQHIHLLDGSLAIHDVDTYCREYEQAIEHAGGLDLVLLGIGRSGYIGFNEPGSGVRTRTRMVTLDEITRKDAAGSVYGDENVPRKALTMGVGTIMEAREVILMATGEHKSGIYSVQ